jgi:Spy/CpxP family protein refolding chaperone
MNSRKKWMAIFAAVSMTGSLLIAADKPAAPTTAPAVEHHRTSTRLVKPWSDLTTLTDEQKAKIEKIHADSTEAQRQIRREPPRKRPKRPRSYRRRSRRSSENPERRRTRHSRRIQPRIE